MFNGVPNGQNRLLLEPAKTVAVDTDAVDPAQ